MMNAEAILDEARATVGVDDPDRAAILPHLEQLVAAIAADGKLSAQGAAITRAALVQRAVDRLEGIAWTQRIPAILDERIDSPLILTGLPRSGTTAFQYLFDHDPRYRMIRTWQSAMPNPPPGADPASVAARKAIEVERRRSTPLPPGFEAVHLMDLDGPEECHGTLEQGYAAAGFHNLLDVPGYFEFLCDGDFGPVTRIHQRQLQLWQWNLPPARWALKYPNHLLGLDAILATYPDARVSMTHRDPVQVVASIARLTLVLRGVRQDRPVDPHHVGRQMLHFIERHVDRLMAFADGPHAGRLVHVDYYRLLSDPAGAYGDAQEALGFGCPDHVREGIRAWHRANPKGKRGANPYALREFGLDEAEVAERFSAYRQRFAIPREHEALAAL
ncbi:sulfotransferase family protein [Novosphingobium bradum]|uniref:Sulfotransferase family protein n=1 Tax=Novosphingobium bradum TaxID=1737444 RepID=A0ABV7IKV7_9SPHN